MKRKEVSSMASRKARLLSILLLLALALPGPSAVAAGPVPPAPMQMGDGGEESGLRVGIYRGTVLDRKKKRPVPGALVIFLNEESGESIQTTTDEKGNYEVELPEGEYIVDIQVGKKVYRSTGSFREEADGRRWVMDFTVGSKLTEKDLKIATTPRDVRLIPTEPRPPLEPSRKMTEFWIFLGGVIVVGALAN